MMTSSDKPQRIEAGEGGPYDGIIKGGVYSELWLDKTSRPSYHSINSVCTVDGMVRFGVDPEAINLFGMRILSSLEQGAPDAMVTAVGLTFMLMLRRFNLDMPSFLQYIDQYMYGPEYKPAFHAMEYLFHSAYDDKVKRSEVVSFKPVKVDFTKPQQ